MAKKNYYSVKASKGNLGDSISFEKDDDNMICIYMEGEELKFTVKEAKEIADKLKNVQTSRNECSVLRRYYG